MGGGGVGVFNNHFRRKKKKKERKHVLYFKIKIILQGKVPRKIPWNEINTLYRIKGRLPCRVGF